MWLIRLFTSRESLDETTFVIVRYQAKSIGRGGGHNKWGSWWVGEERGGRIAQRITRLIEMPCLQFLILTRENKKKSHHLQSAHRGEEQKVEEEEEYEEIFGWFAFNCARVFSHHLLRTVSYS